MAPNHPDSRSGMGFRIYFQWNQKDTRGPVPEKTSLRLDSYGLEHRCGSGLADLGYCSLRLDGRNSFDLRSADWWGNTRVP